MKTNPQQPLAFRPGEHLQMFDEVVHDPYLLTQKLNEPTVCSDCGAVYHNGHWKWGSALDGAKPAQCPACKRIHEKLPAGYVSIQGKFANEHQTEIVSMVRNFASHEESEHPLKRIMSMETEGDSLLITTTDIHLARGIGEALQKAYKGDLDFHYNETEYLLRIRWQR